MSESYDCINKRISKVEEKLDIHHESLQAHDRRLSDLTASLHENTKLTKQIADNTHELVELFRGAKLFRKFFLWAAPLGAAVVVIWNSFFGKPS